MRMKASHGRRGPRGIAAGEAPKRPKPGQGNVEVKGGVKPTGMESIGMLLNAEQPEGVSITHQQDAV